MPTPGEHYEHFKGKGKPYEIVAIEYDSENPKIRNVVYKQLSATKDFPEGTIWTRELSEFMGYKRLASGEKIKRFVKVQKPQKIPTFKDKFPKHKNIKE